MDYKTKFSSVKKLYPHYRKIMEKKGPISITIYPTNACNLNCSFCVNSERDKKEKLTIDYIFEVLSLFPTIKTVEISGGGEPTTWKDLPRLITMLHIQNYEIGLVTNGFNLNLLKDVWNRISWIRISLNGFIDVGQTINWTDLGEGPTIGTSYVISENRYYMNKLRVLMYKYPKIEYCRLTHDIMKYPKENYYEDMGDNIYIFDRRWDNLLGYCYIGSVKPLLAADGRLYQCCLLCNQGREYSKDKALTPDKILEYESFECNMPYCTMNEKNEFIADAMKHDDPHINFV